ncbi:T9SS type A sorting domain-containing protein [candidate division KSB1 bacterium]|nr:T9SS type A sorting domain-containing protein [candidate division KSB1 bacterium]
MHKSLKRNQLPFLVILITILFVATGAFAAKPVPLSAAYVDSVNILKIVFDQPVYNDSTRINRSLIVLDGDEGGKNSDLALGGGIVQAKGNLLSPEVELLLTLSDQRTIENMVDRETLKLYLGERAFLNENLEGNAASTAENAVQVNWIAEKDPLKPISAAYDANTNVLTVTFNKLVVTRTINLINFAFDDDDGGPRADLAFSSDHVEMNTVGEQTTLLFNFSPKLQSKIETANTDNLKLTLNEYAIRDLARNTNIVLNAENSLPVAYTRQNLEEEMDVVSASYDASKNTLSIEFSEPAITTYKWHEPNGDPASLPAITYTDITVYDAGIDSGATLSGMSQVSKAGNNIVIYVLPADQRLIETLKNHDKLKLLIKQYAVLDELGNGCREFTLADNIAVTYSGIDPAQTPTILDVAYDATRNILDLNFGNVGAATRNIDTSDVLLTGIAFDVGGDTIRLSGGTVNGEKTGRPPFIRHVWIDIIPEDEARIETVSNKKNIKLLVEPITFMFDKTKNGNLPITADSNKVVTYITDTTAPAVVNAKYDSKEGKCYLALDKLLKIDKFSPTGVSLGGVKLTSGDVLEATYTSHITIDMSETDKQNIENLDVSKKIDFLAQIDAGMLENLDGVANDALSFKNGDTTSTGESIIVGYGRGFWDKSFEAFPTLDELIPASLRGLGEHCYIYVADAEWDSSVTQADVDTLLKHFEIKCPGSPDKGIYQLCREIYGEEPDTDNDPRIAIVILDLRDEYGLGRSGKYSTFPKAGFFTTNNELPDSVYAHSNEIDMIYIDADPIIGLGVGTNALAQYFSHMIMSNTDPEEFGADTNNPNRWLPEGLGAVAQVICGYNYTSYKTEKEEPIFKPDPTANNVLTRWTGWEAGEVSDLADLYNTFLFTLYLYEQYGGDEIIHLIASDTSNGFTSIDTSLARWARANGKAKVTADEVFDGYALANFVDLLGDPVYGDKYGFEAVNLGTPLMSAIPWATDSKWDTEPNWSFKFYKIKQADIPPVLYFNGINGATMNLVAFTTTEEGLVRKQIDLDAFNEGSLDGTQFSDSDLYMVVSTRNRTSDNASNYVISRDGTPSEFVELGIFQNASADKVLDIYVSAKEQLYNDVPTAAPQTGAGEGPIIKFLQNDKVIASFIANRTTTNSVSSVLYHAEYRLGTSGSFVLKAEGQDMAGNDFQSTGASVSLVVRKIIAGSGGKVVAEDGNSSLNLLAKSVPADMFFTVSELNESSSGFSGEGMQKAYRYGPRDLVLQQAATLEFRYDNQLDGASLAVYHKSGESWIHLGGVVDTENHLITVSVEQLGDFCIAKGQPDEIMETEALPTTYSLSQNYPNPFNPTTTIQFGLPQNSDVTLTIYNILGEQVDQFVLKNQKAGYHKFQWNASAVGSGVYFYKLNAGSFSEIKKMSVLK